MKYLQGNALIAAILVSVALASIFVSLVLGTAVAPGESLMTLVGLGSDTSERIVFQWRLPRVVLVTSVGAALGAAGSLLQSATRNSLGSPDVLGFTSGAGVGVMVVLAVEPAAKYVHIAWGALLGASAAAVAILLLSFRRHGNGPNLILTGISVSLLCSSISTWLALYVGVDTAMVASAWGAGSFNQARWAIALPASIAVALLLLLTSLCQRIVDQSQLGIEVAMATGLDKRTISMVLVPLSVALTAVSTAAAGPVAFIALAAPHLAARLFGWNASILASSLVGVTLTTLADGIAANAFSVQIPTGIVTLIVGGLYLVVLLVSKAGVR